MGLLDMLIASSSRFQDALLPIGYADRRIGWVINIDPRDCGQPMIIKRGREDSGLISPAPPADRTSGKVSPCLLVDKLSYACGFPEGDKKGDSAMIAHREHQSFIELLELCAGRTHDTQIQEVLHFLRRCSPFIPGARAADLCAFQVGEQPWPTDDDKVQLFWSSYVEQRLAEGEQQCVICRQAKPITRILPFKVTLMKGTDPVQLASFNLDAFQSLGKTSTSDGEAQGDETRGGRKAGANAAICYSCASTAGQVLQHLLAMEKARDGEKSSGRHAVILARDKKQSLGNQVAVFWTKEVEAFSANDGEKRRFEDIAKIPIDDLGDIPLDAAPVKAGQLRALLEAPSAGGKNAAVLPANRFYLAVLSPNKSRLVVREWLEENVDKTLDSINRYLSALQIVHPDGRDTWWPPLPALLDALRSYTSTRQKGKEGPRIPGLGPDVMRKFVRCIYTGTPPPNALLVRALRCFRVADPHTEDREQRERQMLRRMAMAAAMKLTLTYQKDKKEMRAMEELETEHDEASEYKRQAPYNCGRLLAILEAAQRGPYGKGVNTTLVDRFYGAASTAPATVFANLINMATKAHLPKLRREGRELFRVRSRDDSININDLMTEACDAINAAGGFPPPMRSEEQAQFALGFYHQRAEFSPSRKQPKSVLADVADKTGGQQ